MPRVRGRGRRVKTSKSRFYAALQESLGACRIYREAVIELSPGRLRNATARPNSFADMRVSLYGRDEALRVVGVERSGTLGVHAIERAALKERKTSYAPLNPH
jgi:hypothetical protein